MNRYTIYCTPEQTRKALEIGAKIITEPNCIHTLSQFRGVYNDGETFFHLPTAEQMIGWLRTKGFRFKIIEYDKETYWQIHYDDTNWLNHGETIKYEEATLAAIDAALKEVEHLDFCKWKKENNKE